MSSTALKNFTAFGFGLPKGRSLPAVTSTGTSSGVQFNSFATWVASIEEIVEGFVEVLH